MGKYDWLNKKRFRSVDQLRLWAENPRLNPEETHLTLSDFAEDLTYDKADRDDFYALITSIVTDGFVPADPIVVWKNLDNGKYYVAEGNRRVTALKLLREPQKAPKSIRSFIRRASNNINLTEIEKIPVNIAPSFEDAEWYINQRNSSSSLQRRWSSEQQRRWVSSLYEKYNGDIERILSITKLSNPELENIIRTLKIKDFIKDDRIKNQLSDEEYVKAISYKFPITILERFFNFVDVREKWGVEFNGIEVNIISNEDSFFNAYGELIRRIVSRNDDKINTRLTKDDLEDVLASLPQVDLTPSNEIKLDVNNELPNNENKENEEQKKDNSTQTPTPTTIHLKGNPQRNKIVLPIYELRTSSYRLLGIFDELKRISINSYKNTISASLRIFLDLAILNYIDTEGIGDNMKAHYRDDLINIPLKRRIEYIKTNHLSGKPQNIATKLIDPSHQYSLDVLNGYVHGQDTHYLNKEFLNGFWDFLFPLFEVLLDIKENNE